MRSLVNKLDELKIWTLTQKGLWNAVSCFFSETCLSSDVSNRVMELEGHTLLRADRSATASCKSHGGGVCIYVNKAWCTDSVVVDTHCSADLEFLFIKCRPFYLPREFTCVIAAAVYVPPDANANVAVKDLCAAVSKLGTKRGQKTLDHVYTSVANAYKATHSPTLDSLTPSLCSCSPRTPPS